MTTHIWSFGADSPMKFEIPDKTAQYYNQALQAFFKAQDQFKRKHNRAWDPAKEPIKIGWSKNQRKAWNTFARIFNEVNAAQGPFHENDLMDDYLVKNAVEKATAALASPSRWISLAAGAGVLYVLLRGLKDYA